MTTQQVDGRGTAVPPTAPERACADWLALRREADTEARDAGAGGLLRRLVDHLRAEGATAVHLVDVGAGTGANHAYLSPRLPFEQSWVVVDHDAELLAHAGHGDAVRVEAGVCDLMDVLDGLGSGHDGTPLLLTCTALLDVLTVGELGCLAEAIARSGGPALLSLSVTGGVAWSPPDPDDATVCTLFDDHQRRGRRAGPEAAATLGRELSSRGLTVVTAPTPWTLDARRPDLLSRWLDERVEAAGSQVNDDGSARVLAAWHRRRRGQLRSAGLAVRVDHVDLLVLPRRTGRAD